MGKRRNKQSVKVIIENNHKLEGFDVYLDFSGQKEYLMHHKRNQELRFMLLKNPYIEDLKRIRSEKKTFAVKNRYLRGELYGRENGQRHRSQKLDSTLGHLLIVIQDYLEERAEWEAESV